MNVVIGIIIALVIFVKVVRKKGNLKFWQKVHKHPDLCYSYFLESDHWHVNDGLNNQTQPSMDIGKWDGPYYVSVPKLGLTVELYGKVGSYEESQSELESMID